MLGKALDEAPLATSVDALRAAVDVCPDTGRGLFAANAALPWPAEPHLALWHGLTCLREHRGDGHNTALVAAGIDGCQAHVLAGAAGGAPREAIQPARGWSDVDWATAAGDLVARGIVHPDGSITAEGALVHAGIERTTDELALDPWEQLGPERTSEVVVALRPLAQRIHAAAVIRQPNPMGLPPLSSGGEGPPASG